MSQKAEEEEVHVPIIMSKDNIRNGLSQIGKTFDGSSVAYIKLDLENKELDEVSEELANYKHLRHINLSGNHFEQITVLSNLPFILKLELKSNKLHSLEIFDNSQTFHYLQHLDLSKNLITSLTKIHLPKLVHLILSHNQISTAHEFKGHDNLKILELRANKLTSLAGIENLASLEELWLGENTISSLDGLSNLPNLKKLFLRKNTFNTLEAEKLPDLPSLAYLNFRENEFVEISKFELLRKYKSLSKIVVTDNPVKPDPSGDVKKEVLIVLPQLKFLGKEEITPEERDDAVNEAAERKKLAEEARKEAEKAAKEALENEEVKNPDGKENEEEGSE